MLGGLEVLGGFGGVADTLNMFNHYLGDPGYLPKYLDEHRKITPAAIKTFAQNYLKKDARVVVYGVAGEPDFGAPVPTPKVKAAPGAGAESVNADEAWRATQPKPAAARDVALPVPSSFTLSNGLGHVSPAAGHARSRPSSSARATRTDRRRARELHRVHAEPGQSSRNALTLANDVASSAHLSARRRTR